MRLNQIPGPLLQLIASIILTQPILVQAKPRPAASNLAGFHFNDLFARYDCAGTYCGFSSQLCCTAGSTCYTDAAQQAQCGAGAATTAAVAESGGYWSVYTSVYTDAVLTTQVMSTYIQSVAAAATTGGCNYALSETPCGSICCASNQYCLVAGQCAAAAGGGSSGYYSSYATPAPTPTPTPGVIVGGGGVTGSAPILGTSSSLVLVTSTQTPTTTEPFMAPVQTGANITLTSQESQGGGLSGGAIAGIVIGVLVGLFLLGLLCFCCCLRGLWHGFAALFGGGKRKRRTVEVEEYERRSHHASGGGGRTWYGASRPARTSRYEEKSKRDSKGNGLFGVGVGLASLWAILGLKRKRNEKKRHDDKSEYSYSSDYYTSASSASSDDRRTRDTRRSISRR
ncbi:hypothetical protein LTR56_023351 [Elasticomyces elasticus]|nr:hypothetical protein LTR56_023351 [Elasticomyces elasticus]KAK3623093.1 hypothetical protein LTR22_024541 [Elasticomyces elasticus]KAK4899315.1 hypothetical protein LTR49_027677 [Elasticomyces elasticus]KAK5749805.1 hypothetical protein LTS12_020165 [Elasticomyces elasticus]